MNNNELKLIYIHKTGVNSVGEGFYDFIFSKDPTNILEEDWGWNVEPAYDNAEPPTKGYYDLIVTLKTDKFDLSCLHEDPSRSYIQGYHNIICLAYEVDRKSDEGYDSYSDLLSLDTNTPLLVFHYGTSLETVCNILKFRKFLLKKKEFIEMTDFDFDDDEKS